MTPFFYELSKKSLSTQALIAGGQRTSEGIFSIFCSFQNPLGQAVSDGSLNFLDYSCLPSYLNRNGYRSIFIQGTSNETSNVGPFAQKTGFSESYGKQSYSNKRFPPNNWGYYDQDVYDYALEKMDHLQEPFLIGINTNTTHSTQLPPEVEFSFGTKNAEDTYKSILHFADQGLKEFVAKIETKKYFTNTIFVFVADHTGYSNSEEHPVNRFLIPKIIYAPHIIQAQTFPFISLQRDLAPTVLDLMNGYLPSLTGVSWLKKDRFVPNPEFYFNSTLTTLTSKKIITFDLSSKNYYCYKFKFSIYPKTPCDIADENISKETQAFTHLSQTLLMQGKTKDWLTYGNLLRNNAQ